MPATLQLGIDNALPYGAGAGNLVFGTSGSASVPTFDLNGHNAQINGLSSSNALAVVDNKSGSGTYTLTVGNNNATATFAGTIKNSSGTLAFVKTGNGTETLAGANTYTGGTTVGGGTLQLSGGGTLGSSSGAWRSTAARST